MIGAVLALDTVTRNQPQRSSGSVEIELGPVGRYRFARTHHRQRDQLDAVGRRAFGSAQLAHEASHLGDRHYREALDLVHRAVRRQHLASELGGILLLGGTPAMTSGVVKQLTKPDQ